MKRLFIEYKDGLKVKITMHDKEDEMIDVYKYMRKSSVKSIIFQQYPKKNNKAIVYR